MKQFITLTFITFILSFCNAQSSESKLDLNPDNIKHQALKMMDFLIKRNCDSFIEFVYPKIIEMFASKKEAMLAITNSWKKSDADSMKIIKFKLGEPSKIISQEDELQCTIPQSLEFENPKSQVIVKSTLIAISRDKGEKWYFIDAFGKNREKIKSIFPNISNQLIIPEQAKPELIKN